MFNSLRNWAWGITAGAIFLANVSCEDEIIPPPPKNNPPQSTLQVSPLTGVAPLEVRIQGSATDPDGMNDIASYEIRAGNYIFKKNPTDTTLVFNDSFGVSSKVVDRSGAEDKKGPIGVQVLHASVSQNAQLQNLVDIKYDASLTNVSQATLDVKRNGQTITTRNITTPTYSETFPGMSKGNYDFALSWRDTSDTKSVQVPNYIPDANFSGLQTNLNEGSEITLDLETILSDADANPEDNPVPLRNATSLDGKTQATINGNGLIIKALGENTGNYGVGVEIGSNEGGINTESLQGNIYDLVRVAGQLQDTRTKTGAPGKINVYQGIPADSTFLGQIETNLQGDFDFRLTEPIQTDLILQARLETGANPANNYTRTKTTPNRDISGVLLRGFPYSDSLSANGISRENFNQFAHDIIFGNILQKPDTLMLNTEIANEYIPFVGTFTTQVQDAMESIITNPRGLQKVTQGRQLNVQKDYTTSARHYQTDSDGHVLANSIEPRWIILFPWPNSPPWGGITYRNTCGIQDITCRGHIFTNMPNSETVINHELLHMILGPGHATTIPPEYTIMWGGSANIRSNPGPADVELGKIVYEETYNPGESIDNILGLNFRENPGFYNSGKSNIRNPEYNMNKPKIRNSLSR